MSVGEESYVEQIVMPTGAQIVLERLRECGYESYIVGGCVRDALLQKKPKDWDICTSATPDEMQQVFRDYRTVETGLKHGTLTVLVDHEPYEATTFRLDGDYTDHRHPDSVSFVREIEKDLARRDFTVNAMAYHPTTGIIDCFGGQDDLKAGVIRCVGNAQKRFDEDALRILRALRFAAVYGFEIEPETDAAIRKLYPTLDRVAGERIWQELRKLLCAKDAVRLLLAYPEVMAQILPPLKKCIGFDQRISYHIYDVYTHIAYTVGNTPPVEALRLAALLHDVGKPDCFTLDENGVGHMHGHAKRSCELAEKALERLRTDNETQKLVLTLIERHDLWIVNERSSLLRWLNRLGENTLRLLLKLERADESSKGTKSAAQVAEEFDPLEETLEKLLAEQPCFTLKTLAVSGSDLKQAGMKPGKQMGETLNRLLEAVMEGVVSNEKEALLRYAGLNG